MRQYTLKNFQGILVFLLTALFSLNLAWAEPTFKAGKDYQEVNHPKYKNDHPNEVYVKEFFSYGCPACARLEPSVEKWLENKPKNVVFEKIPVIFHPDWEVLAKLYYLVQSLNKAQVLTPIIFNAIQKNNEDLSQMPELKAFLEKHGISSKIVDDAFNSPTMELSLKRGEKHMTEFQVMEIPCFVVAGKYKTNLAMANNKPQRMIEILNYLIHKSQEK